LEQTKEWLTAYLKGEVSDLNRRLKENQSQIAEAENVLKVHQTERERLLTLTRHLEQNAKDNGIDLTDKPIHNFETRGEEFYSEIGRKGGERVRRLIQEGKAKA
jgi:hypothetical protein